MRCQIFVWALTRAGFLIAEGQKNGTIATPGKPTKSSKQLNIVGDDNIPEG